MENNALQKKVVWAFCFLAVCLAVGSLFLPLTFQSGSQAAGHAFLVAGIIQSVLQIGSAVLFVIGLKSFKTELKHAYFLIVSSIVILGISTLQIPVYQIINFWNSTWVTHGIHEGVGVIAQVIIIFGLISFAQLLKIKTRLTNPLLIVPIIILPGILMTFIPHANSLDIMPGGTEFSFDLFSLITTGEALLGLFAAALVLKIKRNTSDAYKSPLAWFFLALIFSAIGSGQILMMHFIGFTNFYTQSGFILLPYIIAGALFLKAGYAFNTIKSY